MNEIESNVTLGEETYKAEGEVFTLTGYAACRLTVETVGTSFVKYIEIDDQDLSAYGLTMEEVLGKKPDKIEVESIYGGEFECALVWIGGVKLNEQVLYGAKAAYPGETIGDMAERLSIDEECFI